MPTVFLLAATCFVAVPRRGFVRLTGDCRWFRLNLCLGAVVTQHLDFGPAKITVFQVPLDQLIHFHC